ncbi:MAG TPA: replicative DNA helicase [Clostridia bacterium]|nr:MAG: Replicative DNA helicase [Firmicutes bacterium ADurb.Bin248]HOS19167.1 replicative DNA helicase [Clostridia bacterium]HPK15832.1 replicative DNA helicase [Clostridia bacterium]
MEQQPRVPPHSQEAEKSVLGSMLISRDALELACEMLRPDDFYFGAHRDIFEAMFRLNGRGEAVDAVTVIGALERAGKLAAVGGASYLAELSVFVPSAANAHHYIRIVEDRSVLRQLIKAGGEIASSAQSGTAPINEILDDAERRIFGISMKKSEDTLVHIEQTAMETYLHIGELMRTRGSLSGVPTGFTDLDRLTSGLQKSDLVIVAGRPSMGKTTFALNIAQYAATRGGKKVCVFSLEMSREQLARRLLCANAGVDMHRVNMGETTEDDLLKLSESLEELSGANIYIDDTGGMGVADIRSRCRRQKVRTGLDLVIIDYLQLMELTGNTGSRVSDISEATRSLKILARELEVPIILCSQLSRGPETRKEDNHRPIMADLRESGAIEQDADVVMLLYRPAVYAAKDDPEALADNSAEVIVAKHRNGPTATVTLAWQGAYIRYTNRTLRE